MWFDIQADVIPIPRSSLKGNLTMFNQRQGNINIYKEAINSTSVYLKAGSKVVALIRITWVVGEVEQVHLVEYQNAFVAVFFLLLFFLFFFFSFFVLPQSAPSYNSG